MLRKRIALLLVPVMLLTMLLSAPTAAAASIKFTGVNVNSVNIHVEGIRVV